MDITVTAKLVRETDEAILVTQAGKQIWIPRSQISYLKKQPNKEIVMSLPEWLAQKKNLKYV